MPAGPPASGAAAAVPARFYRAFEAQAAAWDAEFARVAGRFADRLQCRKGCSMCCSQMFPISLLEGAVISRFVAALPPEAREALREAARTYLAEAQRQGLMGECEEKAHERVLPRTGARLPCPALRDNACSVYEARPLICRKWGIPVFDPKAPDRLHACELNFRSGEALDAVGLVAPQRALLDAWDGIRAELREAVPGWRTTTVAEAILSDITDPPQ